MDLAFLAGGEELRTSVGNVKGMFPFAQPVLSFQLRDLWRKDVLQKAVVKKWWEVCVQHTSNESGPQRKHFRLHSATVLNFWASPGHEPGQSDVLPLICI